MQPEDPRSEEASREDEEAQQETTETAPTPPQESHMGRKTIGVDYGLRRTGTKPGPRVCVSVGFFLRPSRVRPVLTEVPPIPGVCVSVGYAPRPLPLITHDNDPGHVASAIAETVRQVRYPPTRSQYRSCPRARVGHTPC
eukprot:1631150-Rhodomonas_salina.9